MVLQYKTKFVQAQFKKASGGYKNYQRMIDGAQLARDVDKVVTEMDVENYELLHMKFITSTKYGGYGGISYTEGAILTFEHQSKLEA